MDAPPEVTSLDARVQVAGGKTSRTDLLPQNLRIFKTNRRPLMNEELVRENGRLRQELAYYKESMQSMMAFYNSMQEGFRVLQFGLQQLSERITMSEENLMQGWGMAGRENYDITTI
ncbi:MAG: hypothetical protein MMC23_006296 [Stictis urceolatum]|nr:hypothetical protein [Stictis urceolata]